MVRIGRRRRSRGFEGGFEMPEDVRFTRDEQEHVVLIRRERRALLGPVSKMGEEMCRFLEQVDFRECKRA
jgi:virulence-associated protein VagC